ncbi:beta-ketoacyl synthase N-terminal-like domain-containing protein [Nocardia sp. NPDC051321]|uniref:beta-ketoacyl synthase N-terminal-like domain-containing protein n=1 Tax=Nocardia sp. NPDC051321 TaxID=3364323 RepID=UPI0037AC2545
MTETVLVGAAIVGAGFPDEDPAAILGARGLRYKDEATRLGMAAAQAALRDMGIDDCADAVTAVVVSSNFGNVDTVCRVVGNGIEAGERGPMDLPNASSNVVASSIAIRFGLFGPNLMLCSGASSGLDAMDWASVLIESRRAARVLVVGVEVDNPMVRRFAGARASSGRFHGAACVIVERADASAARPRAVFGGCVRGAEIPGLLHSQAIDHWYTPDFGPTPDLAELASAAAVVDLADRLGAASGALGVVQAACAACTDGTSLLTTGGVGEPLTACLITSNSISRVGE